jgi:chromate reductase
MPESNNYRIHLVALQGSVRPGNNTAKALALVADEIRKHPGVSLDIVDPTDMHLPLPGQGTSEDATRMRQLVASADGVILATPEYPGSFSSVMKLLIDNLGHPSKLSRKPVALLGVAAGRIGAIKALEHLRSVASHVGALVLPGPVSVARVRSVFDKEGRVLDEDAAAMVRGLATTLIDYIERHTCPRLALESMVRETPTSSSLRGVGDVRVQD